MSLTWLGTKFAPLAPMMVFGAPAFTLRFFARGARFGNAASGLLVGPALASATPVDDADTTLEFAHGDPYPRDWFRQEVALYLHVANQILPGGEAVQAIAAYQQTDAVGALVSDSIQPVLGPPLTPRINELDLRVPQSGVGTQPTISWDAPNLGKPAGYRVTIVRAFVDDSGSGRRQDVASIQTTATSVTIPRGVMKDGEHYYVLIEAMAAAQSKPLFPLRNPFPQVVCQTISALFTS